MGRKINPNFKFLHTCLNQGKKGASLEGSSRSGKTISSVDFIIYLCTRIETNCVINVLKETQVSFKTTLYDDFSKRLDDFGIYNPFADKQEVTSFRIFGNKINFLGADKPSKFQGAGCDYLYINEALEVSRQIFDQTEMRCRKFFWMDYNPKVTEHWIYNSVITRRDVGFLRTTWKSNPFISKGERVKIISYSPYDETENVYVQENELYFNGEQISDTNQPKPHPTNIDEGTADMTNYKVLYHGIRCAPEGLLLKNIKYVDEWPEDLEFMYGNDFGFTVDPNSLVKYGQDDKGDIYVELLCYEPIPTPELLDSVYEKLEIDKKKLIIADSSDKYTAENKGTVEMVVMMRRKGWTMKKVSKKRSIMHWVNGMAARRIHIIKNHLYQYAKIEVENYKRKEISGIITEQPDDRCKDHFIDAARYCYMAFNLYK